MARSLIWGKLLPKHMGDFIGISQCQRSASSCDSRGDGYLTKRWISGSGGLLVSPSKWRRCLSGWWYRWLLYQLNITSDIIYISVNLPLLVGGIPTPLKNMKVSFVSFVHECLHAVT